jgi:maltooligosyltrehalose trehalohydrolase
MQRGERGWWHTDIETAEHGTDYAFLLDEDQRPYPDPRSPWQPYGVHDASRVVDHARYQWQHEGFTAPPLSRAVIYELHTGTFTPEGTFAAAETKLAALRDLGITHVELMPVNSFPGRWGWGYDGASLYAPQEPYGGPDGLKHFVDTCHAHGLAVLLDVVYNHFGPVGNYTGKFAPYITESHHTPWGGAVNLEESGSTEVRRFFCDNALMWLRDYHFDGLRLDAVQTFNDRSAQHFLEQLSEEVHALSTQISRPLVLIAESDLNDPRVVSPRPDDTGFSAFGYGIDAQWSDDFHHSLFALLTGQRRSYYSDFGSLAQLAKSLTSVFVYDGIYSEFRGRVQGRPVRNLDRTHFLGYIQNHDQIGNQAFGERLHTLVGSRKAKLAAALVLTSPFVPMLFQGEEFAASSPFLYFADHDDPILARAVSEGRRAEHSHEGNLEDTPDPEEQETFESSKLNWAERDDPDHAAMLDWHRRLIHLRQSNPCLLTGDPEATKVHFDEEGDWLVMDRGPIRLLFNFGDNSASLRTARQSEVLLASDPVIRIEAENIILPPQSFAALT